MKLLTWKETQGKMYIRVGSLEMKGESINITRGQFYEMNSSKRQFHKGLWVRNQSNK